MAKSSPKTRATIKTRGAVIDTFEIADSLREAAKEMREQAASLVGQKLQRFVDAIDRKSAKRAEAVKQFMSETGAELSASSGTVDHPMRGAKVMVRESRRGNLRNVRTIVYVHHKHPVTGVNLFSILDQPVKAGSFSKPVIFPAYSKSAKAIPKGSIDPGSVRTTRLSGMELRQNILDTGSQKTFEKLELVSVSATKGRAGYGFYETIAREVEAQIERAKFGDVIVGGKRYRIRLKKGNLKVFATERKEFSDE